MNFQLGKTPTAAENVVWHREEQARADFRASRLTIEYEERDYPPGPGLNGHPVSQDTQT